MNERVAEAARLREQGKVQRKRGDALRKAGRELHATEAFEEGVNLLERAAHKLKDLDREEVAADLAETYGAMGGMLRRLGDERRDDALKAYEVGADVEEDCQLSSTYNRLNAIKFRLFTGANQLGELEAQIEPLASLIESNLRSDTKLSDSGWAWADLGDCRALLGRLDEAREAYVTFIRKAEIKSPETTLAVLKELAEQLQEFNDPDAGRMAVAVSTLESRLASS